MLGKSRRFENQGNFDYKKNEKQALYTKDWMGSGFIFGLE